MLEITKIVCLVQHYQNDADGLCTRLAKPLEKKGGKFDFSVDPDSFKKGLMLAIYFFVCLFDCFCQLGMQMATVK